MTDHFAHLDDDLQATLEAPAKAVTPPASYKPQNFEKCGKCSGTGQTRWGRCFRCAGKGGKTYAQPAPVRAQARQQRQGRVAAYLAANPDVAGWLTQGCAEGYGFAVSLQEALTRYGCLTDGQTEAARRCIAKRAAAQVAQTERHAAAPVVSTSKLEEAFAKASGQLKRPKLHIGPLVFKPAGAQSSNAGAIYVTREGEYLGKVRAGRFLSVRSCTQENEAQVVQALVDPLGAAIAHGRLTGSCACCGRQLTDPESVARGIGPICAAKYGW